MAKAAVVTRFGRRWTIELREVSKPAPAANEVLVRVRATTVNRTDCGELLHPILERMITGGQRQRTTLGLDFAGEIEAVGNRVVNWKPEDRVFGMAPRSRDGAQREYICVPDNGAIAIVPYGLRLDQAPVCEGAYYANASVGRFCRPGCNALIYGAGGAIGAAAVQLAKFYGAEVTAVVAKRQIGIAKSLGADRVINYESTDFARLTRRFDFVLDAVGKLSIRQWRPLLKSTGSFAATDIGPHGQTLLPLVWSTITRDGRVSVPLPQRGSAPQFVKFLKSRMEAGNFRAVVDRRYSLDAIDEAYRYVQAGEKTGIVVIDV